jgi:RNA-splicing ligase RtcB
MIQIKGKYNTANVMIDEIDEATHSRIQSMVNHPAFAKTYIAIMPDCHEGKGSVIGFTAKLNDYIIPNVVGVDIGCGVDAYKLDKHIDFVKFDMFCRRDIPHGRNRREKPIYDGNKLGKLINADIEELSEQLSMSIPEITSAIGTLGGGNHFIEIDEDNEDNHWLLIHSGSRHFGLRICDYYQSKAKRLMEKMFISPDAYKDAEFLPADAGGREYIYDMQIAQRYASLNRKTIAESILNHFGVAFSESIFSIHNYIDMDNEIIRKGAISAQAGEKLLIPLNMRDGCIVGVGKGSGKWNFSAPHGAGRLLSRAKAKESLHVDEFKKQMEGVFSNSVSGKTLDESPMAYKAPSTILEAIDETVEVKFVMKSVCNFKATDK